MPCKKNKQPLPKPKCSLSSRRLLETVPIQDLCQSAVVCVPSSKRVNETSSSESGSSGSDEDACAPGTCSALNPQYEESSRSHPAQELKMRTCVSNSQAMEVEAMIDEIRNCREIIRSLTLEAMNILHPENSQQYKQNLEAQQVPVANANVSCCEHYDDLGANPIEPACQPKPIDLRQKSDCSKKKCEMPEPIKCSGSEGQSTTRLFPIPPTLPKSPALSRKSSGPIAQTAYQIKDKRLGQTVDRKKPSICTCDGEKKQNVDCSCDETTNKNTLGKTPSNCGCDGEKRQNINCRCDETMTKKILGKTPTNCGCDGEKNQNINCRCDETMNKRTLINKPSACSCDEKKKNKADCKCDDSKTDFKTCILKTFGKKPSECSCDGEKRHKANCKCDHTMKKRSKENENRKNKTDCKGYLQKTFGWISCDTGPVVIDDCICGGKEKEKQTKACLGSKAAACAMPKCAAKTCTCHFPPAYSQYFECTGNVSGNCQCHKNA